MPRWFNVAGPCRPDIHYMLPATARLPDVMRLIAQQSYFVLHAPRQTGKTTAMLEPRPGADGERAVYRGAAFDGGRRAIRARCRRGRAGHP